MAKHEKNIRQHRLPTLEGVFQGEEFISPHRGGGIPTCWTCEGCCTVWDCSTTSTLIISSKVKVARPEPRILDPAVRKANWLRHCFLYVGDDVEGTRDAVLVDRQGSHQGALRPRIGSLAELVACVCSPAPPAPR